MWLTRHVTILVSSKNHFVGPSPVCFLQMLPQVRSHYSAHLSSCLTYFSRIPQNLLSDLPRPPDNKLSRKQLCEDFFIVLEFAALKSSGREVQFQRITCTNVSYTQLAVSRRFCISSAVGPRWYWPTGNYYILNSETIFNVTVMYRKTNSLPEFLM